jgi:hypothetical protein
MHHHFHSDILQHLKEDVGHKHQTSDTLDIGFYITAVILVHESINTA